MDERFISYSVKLKNWSKIFLRQLCQMCTDCNSFFSLLETRKMCAVVISATTPTLRCTQYRVKLAIFSYTSKPISVQWNDCKLSVAYENVSNVRNSSYCSEKLLAEKFSAMDAITFTPGSTMLQIFIIIIFIHSESAHGQALASYIVTEFWAGQQDGGPRLLLPLKLIVDYFSTWTFEHKTFFTTKSVQYVSVTFMVVAFYKGLWCHS